MRILFARYDFEAIAVSDDYGLQLSMAMAPDTWRRLIKPCLSAIYAAAKSVRAKVLKLVGLRNRAARDLGYSNHYEMSLTLQEQDPDETENLAPAPGDDPNNGGWAGINPHTTPIRKPEDGLPPGHIVKAETASDFQIVDEASVFQEWAPALHRQLQRQLLDHRLPPGGRLH